jgi:hypothetical protein
MCNDRIRFRWNDYRATNKWKVMTLQACEFIRRGSGQFGGGRERHP